MADTVKKVLTLAALAACAAVCLAGPRAQGGGAPAREANLLANWRPTQGASDVRYVGSAVCVRCHEKQASTYFATPMARAAEPVADSEVLAKNPRLSFRNGPYSYEIARKGGRSVYTVSDGAATISEPILHCFGLGVSGQTYIFRHDGTLYEGRVSYFRSLGGLDITILHPRSVPASLEDAVGRKMSPDDARGCFACHTTPPAGAARADLDRLVPGVGCESCHGPGEKHLEAVKVKDSKNPQIFNPKVLDALDLAQEFCGACHMSFDKVMLMPNQAGINNIRFQPYRVFKSGAHLLDDARMSCVACHDPHDELEHEPAFYDAKCLACHVSSPADAKTEARGAAACPVSTKQCVTCHMPKVELPEMHAKFTDHWLRIAKPGEPVPN